MKLRSAWRIVLAATVAAALAPQTGTAQKAAALPPQLDAYISKIAKLAPALRADLMKGLPVTAMLETDPSREVAVFGAIWVGGSIDRYLSDVQNIEQFERGANFRITKLISTPPRAEDFAQLDLPPDDVQDLKSCRVGSCELKLSEPSLARLRKEVDFSKPTAQDDTEALARRLALEYVTGYLEGGNARLAVYRDSSRPTFVAAEFKDMIDRMPSLTADLPDLKRYLLEYPKAQLPDSSSFLYWQEAQFGLKPTIRINHVVTMKRPTHAAVASKMLYASHYFWTALELRVLVPDPSRGAGFWFASVTRSRSDGLSGFAGKMIRGKVRGEAEKGMVAALKTTKARVERPAGS